MIGKSFGQKTILLCLLFIQLKLELQMFMASIFDPANTFILKTVMGKNHSGKKDNW